MSDNLTQQFRQLTDVLLQYQAYWRLLPFACDQLPWPDIRLQQQLDALPDQAIDRIDQSAELQQQYFADIFPALFALPAITVNASPRILPALPFWLSNGIAGRKLQQLDAFCALQPDTSLPVVEWCAGKGHLGRLLAYRFAQPVLSVEWQQALCEQGSALATQFSLPQQFVQADVLNADIGQLLQPEQHLVALHACGQLHISMLQHAVQAKCKLIQLVPCCYHLIPQPHYSPMSALALQHNLQLDQNALKLVVQGQVTAGERIERLRQTEVTWRLSYELLRQHLLADTEYRPLASVAKHFFSGPFSEFALWAASQHQLTLPQGIDWHYWLQQGAARYRLVQRIELVRHLFRRPLEHWLLLDRALYLQQHGYSVSLQQFCEYEVTPRNILLQAELT